MDLGRHVSVEDRGDGSYACQYSVAETAVAQTAKLQVRVNGEHASGSPFSVAVAPRLPSGVRVYGLRSSPGYNGLAATVVSEANGRACVRLDQGARELSLSTENLRPLSSGAQQTFEFLVPFDHGVLFHIATGGGQGPFSNPHDSGRVRASMSSVGYGSPSNLVQGSKHNGSFNYTLNPGKPGAWMAVDLRRQLRPSYYCLRSDKHGVGALDVKDAPADNSSVQHPSKPRNWRLEGSNDGRCWTPLRVHCNDCSLSDESFSVAAWPLEDTADFFRHFRIYQTGPNSAGTHQLMCAGIELYGTLLDAEDELAHTAPRVSS